MIGNSALVGLARVFTVSLVLWVSKSSLAGAEANITRTNWSDRWITNVIELTMPVNHFVNEYHTNWVTHLRTNVFNVYATNHVLRTETNRVVVDAFQTNYAVSFHTNWNMRRVTNHVVVDAIWTNTVVEYRTNRIEKTQINPVTVTLLQTNIVNNYQTNWSTLSLTNWETVVLFKTNWLSQPVTNFIQVDMPARAAAAVSAQSEPVPPQAALTEPGFPAPSVDWTGPLAIEAARTSRPPANDLVEVRLRVRWTGQTANPLQVQNWRVEREDGAVFLFGQEQEIKRQLPLGKYKVEARLKANDDNPPLVARGTLVVTLRDAVVQQYLWVKK
ncbi:MAG TPA: hypothetical protein P5205_09195 [Candidatus Paceibacterota bacterium]|nr:hypothetical protein [Verrucomicrobiota bacterium]HSA10531.1 hypothetical protein [Candidatus Paceibacterota bacterium]